MGRRSLLYVRVRMPTQTFRRALPAAATLAVALAAAAPATAATAPKPTARAAFTAHGSIGQAYVLGAKKGQRLLLVDASNRIVRTGRADRLGSKIFRSLPTGARYTVRSRRGGKVRGTKPFRILD